VGHFRIELLDEQATEIREIITVYRDLLAGRVGGRDVWTQLKAMNRVGITRGTLEEKKNPLAIV
jgi:putative protease